MQKKNKIALFDFCETIANFQTGDAFIYYVLERYKSKRAKRWSYIYSFLLKSRIIIFLSFLFPKASINKRLVLRHIKGYSAVFLETCAHDYYYHVVKPNFIPETISILQHYIVNRTRVVIVSAGYEIYLKYFMKDYNLPLRDLIAVNIEFNDGICKGRFDGGDRLFDKTEKLDLLLNKESFDSVAYSDSPSDIPLLEWANEGIVVRRKDKKQWSKKYKEIIWHI